MFGVEDHLSVESKFLIEYGLVICRAYSLLGAYTVAVVDSLPLYEVAAWELYYNV